MKFLIPPDFSFEKYFPAGAPLPPEAKGARLREEIARRAPQIDVLMPADDAAFQADLAQADALVAYSISHETLDRAKNLKWIQAGSAGIDHFLKSSGPSLAEIRARGIVLTKASGVTRIVIGEHVFAMILAMSRGVPRAVRQQDRRHWEIFMGAELSGATLGIVGLGEIGERVAELGKAFGMHVIGSRRSEAPYAGHADTAYGADAVDNVIAEADYLVLACSLNASTRGLIDRRTLGLMKPGAVLVNVSRGEIVVEADLVDALRSGRIAGAALDTFGGSDRGALRGLEELDAGSPLWDLPNVLVMPNNASATPVIFRYLAEIIVENHRRMLAGERLKFEVVEAG